MPKKRPQRSRCVDVERQIVVPVGMTAFADLFDENGQPRDLRPARPARPPSPDWWEPPGCREQFPGCRATNCAGEHGTVMQAASAVGTDPMIIGALVVRAGLNSKLFDALVRRSDLTGQHLHALARCVTGRRAEWSSSESESQWLRLLELRLPAAARQVLIAHAVPSPLVLLAIFEHPSFTPLDRVTAAHTSVLSGNRELALAAWSLADDHVRVALSLRNVEPSLTPLALHRRARGVLSRFAAWRHEAVATIEALSRDWAGSVDDLVSTAALLRPRS